MSTIFTKIINREIPAYILYEDDLVIAFLDISQATKGHTLVVTKNEYTHFFEVPEDVLKHLFTVCQTLGQTLVKKLDAKGFNLLNNNGAVAGQTVFHYHVHLIPRYDEKEVLFSFKNHGADLSKDDYLKLVNQILD
mgnify:FL=1